MAVKYFMRPLNVVEQVIFFAGSILLIKPGLTTDAGGLAVLLLAAGFHYLTRNKTMGGKTITG